MLNLNKNYRLQEELPEWSGPGAGDGAEQPSTGTYESPGSDQPDISVPLPPEPNQN